MSTGSLFIQPSYVVPAVFLIMKFLGIFPIPTLFDGRCPQPYLEELGGSSVRERGGIDWGNCKVSPGKEIGSSKVQGKFTQEITYLLPRAHAHALVLDAGLEGNSFKCFFLFFC